MRLSVKIILIVTILLTASFGALVWRSKTLMEAVVLRAVGEQQVQLAQHTMSQVDTYLYERMRNIETLSKLFMVETILTEKMDAASKRETIVQIAQMNGPWDSVSLVSNEGVVEASTLEGKVGKKLVDGSVIYTQYLKAREGNLGYSDKVISEESGQETMVFSAPVWQKDAQIVRQLGVVITEMAWPPISEILSKVDSHALLIDSQGKVIAENNAYGFSVLLGEDVRGVKMINQALTEKTNHFGMTTSLTGNIPVLMSHVPELGQLDYVGNGWILGLEFPRDLLLAKTKPWVAEMMVSVLPIVTAGVLLIVLSIIIFVLQPISQLSKAGDLIKQGNFSQRIKVRSNDELGRLGEYFNQMVTQLENRQREMEQETLRKPQETSSPVEERTGADGDLSPLVGNVVVGTEPTPGMSKEQEPMV